MKASRHDWVSAPFRYGVLLLSRWLRTNLLIFSVVPVFHVAVGLSEEKSKVWIVQSLPFDVESWNPPFVHVCYVAIANYCERRGWHFPIASYRNSIESGLAFPMHGAVPKKQAWFPRWENWPFMVKMRRQLNISRWFLVPHIRVPTPWKIGLCWSSFLHFCTIISKFSFKVGD